MKRDYKEGDYFIHKKFKEKGLLTITKIWQVSPYNRHKSLEFCFKDGKTKRMSFDSANQYFTSIDKGNEAEEHF